MAFAFGCEAYTPTTRLFKTYFTTQEAYVGEVSFELIFDKYYDGAELEELYPADFAGASGNAVLPVRAYTEKGTGFYYGIYDGDYTDLEEWPDQLIIDNLIYNGVTEPYGNYAIPYNTTRTALGVAYDAPSESLTMPKTTSAPCSGNSFTVPRTASLLPKTMLRLRLNFRSLRRPSYRTRRCWTAVPYWKRDSTKAHMPLT